LAGHAVHAAEPVSILYVPAPQAVHAAPLRPVKPLLQVQLASALQPLHEAPELAGHAVHAAEPVAILYFPAPQAVHAAPLEPVKPLLQVQLASAVQPLHEAPELAGHVVHILESLLNVPAPQFQQEFPPFEVCPAGHNSQIG
jgi:hypothetical protein